MNCKWLTLCLLLFSTGSVLAWQEPVDLEMVSRIRLEAFGESKALDTLTYLTEEIGPRLTNSPSMKRANEWTRRTLEEWGLANAHLEEWGPFGRGWSYSHVEMHMTQPRQTVIQAMPKAWTPGTDGTISGEVIRVEIDSEEDFAKYEGKLKGKILFLDEAREYELKEDGHYHRYTDEELADMCHYEISGKSRYSGWRKRYSKYMKLGSKLRAFYKEQGALATVNISSRNDGILRVTGGGSYDPEEDPGITALVIGAEQYNMILRQLDNDTPVELSLNVAAQFHDDDMMGYNTIAEIPGYGDLRHEVVLAGAHLDSWHAGNGAMDNGAGVAMVMEAMRILKNLDVKPRRTIRVALWSGEEQGLHGSRGHVKQHYAERIFPDDPETQAKLKDMPSFMKSSLGHLEPKPDHKNISAYYNLDNGCGKIRGIYGQLNAGVQPIFKAWLEPFHDVGATAVTMQTTGGTDHQAFDQAGIPGFQFIQDPLSYFSKNHHSNLDVLDHVQEADLKQAAAVLASFLYHTAMRDEKLPRKPMPKQKPKKLKKAGMGN